MDPTKINPTLKSRKMLDIKEKLGSLFELSGYETKVYMAILSSRALTATTVSKVTGIRRSRTYEILRNLKEKGFIDEENRNPKIFIAKSPRLVVDTLISKRQREIQEESAAMLGVLQVLQDIWTNQHEEQLGSHFFLLSEHFVREVMPQEIHIVKDCLCLAIKEPSNSLPETQNSASPFFDHKILTSALNEFSNRGAILRILIGNLKLFLKKSWPEGISFLIKGIKEGFIEVKEIGLKIPHSFLIVDHHRAYMFFLDSTGNRHREAIRTEIPGLIETLDMFWSMLWESGNLVSAEWISSIIMGSHKK